MQLAPAFSDHLGKQVQRRVFVIYPFPLQGLNHEISLKPTMCHLKTERRFLVQASSCIDATRQVMRIHWSVPKHCQELYTATHRRIIDSAAIISVRK